MYHFREYFELTNAYTNTPLIQENTSHKKTLPSSGNIHCLSSYRSFLINCLTSFDYSNSNSMTCQFHKEVKWCLEMPPTWPKIRWAIWAKDFNHIHLWIWFPYRFLVTLVALLGTNIALPRKVWKMNFDFPGWYISLIDFVRSGSFPFGQNAKLFYRLFKKSASACYNDFQFFQFTTNRKNQEFCVHKIVRL